MNYHQLGNSDLKISEISFGCMSLEREFDTSRKLIHLAINKGINYFDTADIYQNGENEIILGKALKEYRNQVIIGTKVGNQPRPDGKGWDWNPKKKYIIKAVENSLSRLQTDYIDLYQLHGGTIEDPIDETIDAFETLVTQGKIRYYGISSIRPNVIREYTKRSNIISVMMQYSLLDRRPEESCLNFLCENNIGVIARGALAKGLLAGKTATDYLQYTPSEVTQISTIVKEIAGKRNTMSKTAIKFVLEHPAIISAAVGIRSEDQLLQSIGTSTNDRLSKEEFLKMQQAIEPNFYTSHR
ncbi:aldo/keto reductase [Aquimarina addita]|uniref:Aldo/keto reductase n=1 Tax=Aquimarina addita TaxID=870485 RepID=A0ABP7XCP8_9FLAO